MVCAIYKSILVYWLGPEVTNINYFLISYHINIMALKVIYYHVNIISKKVICDSYHIIYP
jgi:hypothetical protein